MLICIIVMFGTAIWCILLQDRITKQNILNLRDRDFEYEKCVILLSKVCHSSIYYVDKNAISHQS